MMHLECGQRRITAYRVYEDGTPEDIQLSSVLNETWPGGTICRVFVCTTR